MGFQPPFDEGHQEAMEYASGLISLIGVAADYRELLSTYLRGDAVSPVPIQRLAARHPGAADAVFAGLLNRKGFRWERSGELLLRTHKPGYYDTPPLPTVIPMTGAITEHLSAPAVAVAHRRNH